MDEKPIVSSGWIKVIKAGIVVYGVVFLALLVGLGFLIYFAIQFLHQQPNQPSGSPATAPTTQTTQTPPTFKEVTVDAAAPTLGQADAAVTLIEFADFQCPFCKKFQDTVFPAIRSQYIDTGKAKFIFQDFAFLGPESIAAAAAAKCAAEQQRFWPYHDLLYAKQGNENSGVFSDANLKAFAGQLQLNQSEFNSCVDSGKYKQAVAAETAAGETFGVDATPTLFVNGQKYSGVSTVEQYQRVIDQALSEAKQ